MYFDFGKFLQIKKLDRSGILERAFEEAEELFTPYLLLFFERGSRQHQPDKTYVMSRSKLCTLKVYKTCLS